MKHKNDENPKNLQDEFELEQEEKNNKRKKSKNSKKKKRKKRFLRKLFLLILIIGLCILIYKLYTFKTMAEEMFTNSPSTVLDSSNNIIAEIGSERNRENISYDKIPPNLINAYISIEDERYYSHHGVDVKRTGGAILNYIIHRGSSSFGGSTITQQLVKNITGDDSSKITRKVKEWFYAWTLNICFSKEEILEAYFNIIYTGPNIYGVQTASHYYFNKDIENLSLAECAYLAGLNKSPNSYNPFSETENLEKIIKRTTVVLNKMLQLEYISESEYNLAILEVDKGLKFNKGTFKNNSTIYSYHTDSLINEIISDLSESKHISTDFATNFLYLSGSKIYSTQNSSIQKILEKETSNTKYIIKSTDGESNSQSATVIINHLNGQVIACTGRIRKKNIISMF